MAPAEIAARATKGKYTQGVCGMKGNMPGRYSPTADAAIPPITSCPSAPMFQKSIKMKLKKFALR